MATKLTKPVVREVLLKVCDEIVCRCDEGKAKDCCCEGEVKKESKECCCKEGPVLVTMSECGLELRRKGTGRKLFVPWHKLGGAMELPGDAPAKYFINPLGWLVE